MNCQSGSRQQLRYAYDEAKRIFEYVKGTKRFPKNMLVECQSFFKELGWRVVKPCYETALVAPNQELVKVSKFFNTITGFKTDPLHFADLYTVYKEKEGQVSQAMVLAFFRVGDNAVCHLESFAVCAELRKKGLGTQAIYQLQIFLEDHILQFKTGIVGAYIFVGMSKIAKPHDFFYKLGFSQELPNEFASWNGDQAVDRAYLFVSSISNKQRLVALADLLSISDIKQAALLYDSKKKQVQNVDLNGEVAEDKENPINSQNEVQLINNPALIKGVQQMGFVDSSEEQKDQHNMVSSSCRQSSISVMISKTKSGAINKHCMLEKCDGKLTSGYHWAKHIRDKHAGLDGKADGAFVKCAGADCKICTYGSPCTQGHLASCTQGHLALAYQLSLTFPKGIPQGYSSGKRASYICVSCGNNKRYDKFSSDSKKICKSCLSYGNCKGKSVVIKATNQTQGRIIKSNINQFPQVDLMLQVEAEDGISHVGQKRAFLEREQDHTYPEQEHMEPLPNKKSNKNNSSINNAEITPYHSNISDKNQMNIANPTNQDLIMDDTFEQIQTPANCISASVQSVIRYLAHTDEQVISQLKEIIASHESVQFCASSLQELCHMFTQDYICSFLATQSEEQLLIDCIVKVLNRVNQLNDEQVLGLLAASFAIGGVTWLSSVKFLGSMTQERKNSTLKQFSAYLSKNHSQKIIDWCKDHWKCIEQQQLNLIKYLSQQPSANEHCILTLSLVATIQDNKKFVTYASSFINGSKSAAGMMVDAIDKHPHQVKITFEEFIALTDLLQDYSNAASIQSIQDELFETQVNKWTQIIEMAAKAEGVADVETIQGFIDELMQAYGQIKFGRDLTLTEDDRFQMFMLLAENIPNSRQFAVAQYSVSLLDKTPRQMWNIPAGQGKGRIEHTIAVLTLFLGIMQKVHMVYNCEELMERDRAEFQSYLMFLDDAASVEYHACYENLEPADNELVIIDEADNLIFRNPTSFRAFISKCACLCFTATPDDQGRGVDNKVINSLQFQKFHYYLDKQKQKVDLVFDEVPKAATARDKAKFIGEQSTLGPVVVYCDNDLLNELQALNLPLIFADRQVDHAALRCLDHSVNANQYNVVVATQLAAMRGLDYRSKGVKMCLVIAKSFSNWRDACQGYNRVGRFGDICKRIHFADVPIINQKEGLMYQAKCFKFVTSMQKTQIMMKAIKVKEVVPPALKEQKKKATYISEKLSRQSKLGQNRINTLFTAGQTTLKFY